jgi:histidine ammonia-lyase
MAACQAIEFRRPLQSSPVLEFAHDFVRRYVSFASEDRIFADDIGKVAELIQGFSLVSNTNLFSLETGLELNGGFDDFTIQ